MVAVVQSNASINSTSVSLGSNVTPGNSVLLQANCFTTAGAPITTSAPTFGGLPVTGATLLASRQSPSSDGVYVATWLLPDLAGAGQRQGVRASRLEGRPVRQVFSAVRRGAGRHHRGQR